MGDHDDAAKLCESEAGRLIGYLVTRGASRHEAEDVAQDAFLVVCRKGQQVTAHPNPKAFLYKIARGVARDRQRSATSRAANEIRSQRRCPPPCDEPAASVPLVVDVERALAELSRRQREVVYLHRCADLALPDVASVLEMSLGAAKSHLRRGEARLRVLLADDPSGAGDGP